MRRLRMIKNYSAAVLVSLGFGILGCVPAGLNIPGSTNSLSDLQKKVDLPSPDEVLKVKMVYKGYSKDYKPVRELIYDGKFDQAIAIYKQGGRTETSEKEPAQALSKQKQGIAKVQLNVRKTPGIKGKRLGALKPKGVVTILEEEKGWCHVKGEDVNGRPIEGWASAKYIDEATNAHANAVANADLPKIDLDSSALKTLHHMELGVLNMEVGNQTPCYNHLEAALKELEMMDSKGIITSKATSTLSSLGSLALGNPELTAYAPTGYEKVMLLNYKSVNYLLNGDRKALNVARQAINLQNMERDAFMKELADAKAKAKAEKEKESKNEAMPPFLEDTLGQFKKLMSDTYSDTHKIAAQASSAYVNPFADYLNGMIMELESYSDPSFIDDAQRAYKKASELNPKSKMLKAAANEMKKAKDKGQVDKKSRLLNVVVYDGFSPEKKVAKTIIPISSDKFVTVQLPKMDPLTSKVTTIKVLTPGNKVLAKMDVLANMDAMVLRHQKELEPLMYTQGILMILRSYFGQELGGRFLGSLGSIAASALVDGTANPETRAWSSLPSKICASRIKMPKGLKAVKIASYDAKGRLIASRTVDIQPGKHNFVYGRSYNGGLYARAPKKLWVN